MAATSRVAAVLLPIVYNGDECRIIFTKRLRDLNSHGGEVSFPGGIKETADSDLSETALRETCEEIGVSPSDVNLLGTLDDELSKGGHRVTPYAGLLKTADFTLQTTEVERVYSIPVSYLLRRDIYYSEYWIKDGFRREVHFYRYGDDIIWGLTARILYNFMNLMTGFPDKN